MHKNAKGRIRRRELPSGKVRYQVLLRINGREKSYGSFGRKKEASARLSALLIAVAEGSLDKPPKKLFSDYAEQWLKSVEPRLKPSTYATYKTCAEKHLVPRFGSLRLDEIGPTHVDAMKNELWEKYSPRTANKVRVVLSTMFNDAMALGLLEANPVPRTRPVREERREMQVYSAEEVRQLLAACESPLREMVLVAVTTGLRQGELLGLRWMDVDFDAGVFYIKQTWNKQFGFGKPKTKAAERAVVVPRETLDALSPGKGEDLVFSDEGNPWDSSALLRDMFYPACERAGIKKIRWHDLRHTYAALSILNGENLKYISEQMGHTSIVITMDSYGHLYPAARMGAASRLSNLIFDPSFTPFGERNGHSAVTDEQGESLDPKENPSNEG